MAEENKQDKKEFQLVQVPTEFGLAIQTPEGEKISQMELLVQMANTLDELKKSLIGN